MQLDAEKIVKGIKLSDEQSGRIINSWGDQELGPSFCCTYCDEYHATFGDRMEVQSRPMTALVCAYTPEGFVVGADGVRVDARTNQDITSDAQKLFPIDHSNFNGIHAWAGATWLFSSGNGPFIFSEEAQHLIKALSKTPVASLSDYVTRLGSGIYQRLLAHIGAAIPNTTIVSKNLVARALFVGYIGGHAWRVQIIFPHENGLLSPPVLSEVSEASASFCIVSGSQLAWRDLQPVFAPESLAAAANLVRMYIQLCAKKRYEYDDCKNIGGHIHIAAVTPEKTGWIDPPRDNAA